MASLWLTPWGADASPRLDSSGAHRQDLRVSAQEVTAYIDAQPEPKRSTLLTVRKEIIEIERRAGASDHLEIRNGQVQRQVRGGLVCSQRPPDFLPAGLRGYGCPREGPRRLRNVEGFFSVRGRRPIAPRFAY